MINGDQLLHLYANGCFPMWDSESLEIQVFRPDPRAVIELDDFHVPSRLMKRIRQSPFRISSNESFSATFDACHEAREEGSWMCEELRAGYIELYERGFAHSIEAWLDETLIGGLYGVHIGSAFMAESMFSKPKNGGSDSSKICLVKLVEFLRASHFQLLDVQFSNPHLEQFGVREISADDYQRRLAEAISCPGDWIGIEKQHNS